MKNQKLAMLAGVGVVFMTGAAFLVLSGRPVAQQPVQEQVENPSGTTGGTTQEYVLADVEQHTTPESCWAAVNGSVYDLTTWINRHPGGSRAIESMCGKDSTEAFTRKHGRSSQAQAELALLKIGVLKQ